MHLVADLGSVRVMSAGARAEVRGASGGVSLLPRLFRAALSSNALSSHALSSDVRGVVIVEYVVVLLLVSMLACGAILLLGMAISKFYFSQEAWIGIPLP